MLSKTSSMRQEALGLLSERSIKRREKVLGDSHLLTYDDLPLDVDYISSVENFGVKIENKLYWFNAVSAYLNAQQKNEIEKLPFVKNIVPVKILKFGDDINYRQKQLNKKNAFSMPADYGDSYGQEQLSDIPIVHSKGITGNGVMIGILDNGFWWKQHESLVTRKVAAEYNFVFHTESTAPQPGDASGSGEHGTFVFSIIGGYKDSSIIGVAYNATFVLAKTEDDRSESHIEEDNYAAALQWMDSLGVDLTTSSLGYNVFDDTTYSYTYQNMDGKSTIITKAAELAYQKGILVLNSAGNEGDNNWHYIIAPADGVHVIAVGAVDNNNILAAFSSRGPTYDGRIKPDIVAQGVNDFGASVPGYNYYSFEDGTSFAAPIASGVAGLLLSEFPYLTNEQARYILIRTAGNYDNPNNDRGYGLVSAANAISFPNIYADKNAGTYTINKVFFSQIGVVPSSVKLHYTLDFKSFTNTDLNFDGRLKYGFAVPAMPDSQSFSFYYTYQDSSGASFREPSSNYYTLKYGRMNVDLGSAPVSNFVGNVLSRNYPNPFNAATKIDFYSAGSDRAKLIVIDGIGQTVKVLFNGTANIGINTVEWDGKNSYGVKCASGVYYYILTLAGKDYGNKLVLLR